MRMGVRHPKKLMIFVKQQTLGVASVGAVHLGLVTGSLPVLLTRYR